MVKSGLQNTSILKKVYFELAIDQVKKLPIQLHLANFVVVLLKITLLVYLKMKNDFDFQFLIENGFQLLKRIERYCQTFCLAQIQISLQEWFKFLEPFWRKLRILAYVMSKIKSIGKTISIFKRM